MKVDIEIVMINTHFEHEMATYIWKSGKSYCWPWNYDKYHM